MFRHKGGIFRQMRRYPTVATRRGIDEHYHKLY